MTVVVGEVQSGGQGVGVGGVQAGGAEITDFTGSDKLVGMRILPTVGPRVLYWENVKSLDVQRLVNSAVLSLGEEEQIYGGFGNQSFKDAEVICTLFLMQSNPLGVADENTLEQFLSSIHTNINQYYNSSQIDTVATNPVVWIKITDENREDEVRGIILYEIKFQVRIYMKTPLGLVSGSSSAGLEQLMLNFLGGLNSSGWTALPFSTVKSIDLQRSGNIIVVHAPAILGRVMGIGEGQQSGQYTQQQISQYTFRLTMYGSTEDAVNLATDFISTQSVIFFLNAPFGNGLSILSKMMSYGQVLNERGVWMRDIDIMVEAIVAP
jgi:hypothetical protein